ncbi:MAG: 30S ribosomal protein S12 methylthiotransferase RimO [Bacteroidales bacterium]|nr:30S ribosomal protein S12 methylthiotransferase RimO [Bacteroidales bacterium]
MQKGIINLVSLGCSKNTVDSESLAGKLISEGFSVEFNIEEPSFDFVIINTCGFIDKAKEESVNTILEFITLRKEENKNFKIIVYGCLAQRYKDDLLKELPEIDFLAGITADKEIIKYIGDLRSENGDKNSENQNIKNQKSNTNRKLSNADHYAYVKISEGCDRRCSFCAIPLIKGKHVSRPIEDIVEEVNVLTAKGVKEIILIAQDTSYYGLDLYGKRRLYDLLKALCKTSVHWIRLQYSYPNQFPLEVLELMNEEKKICRYLDMPLQHINNRILQSMNRNITDNEILSLINKIRLSVKDIALRTTLIVGYPTETKQEFNKLKSFVSKIQFDRMGAFTYSKEEGTAAAKLKDNITQSEKQKRLDELTEIQQEISFNLNQNKIGKVFETIIDRKEGEYFIGRTQYDSPEVDNEVLISAKDNPSLKTGNFYDILITDATEFDLYGTTQ